MKKRELQKAIKEITEDLMTKAGLSDEDWSPFGELEEAGNKEGYWVPIRVFVTHDKLNGK